jgi:uncharacterized protein YraI
MLQMIVSLFVACMLLLAPLTGLASLRGTASSQPNFTPMHQTAITATVKVPRLNVRAGPGTIYRVLAQVSQGTRLAVLDWTTQSQWLKIVTPNQITGWVSTPLVNLSLPQEVLQPSPADNRNGAVSVPSAGNLVPVYASQPFRPNTVTSRGGYIHECFGAGASSLRQVPGNTPVQVVGKADFQPPGEEATTLGTGPFLKIRLWDGQYAWMRADDVQVDPGAVPVVSNQCEPYDRIDWAKVVRPTPTPTPPPESDGGHAGCCKICRKGKACGNTCISRQYTCWVGPGCACNG